MTLPADASARIDQVRTLAEELTMAMRSQPDFVNEYLAGQAERLAATYREWQMSKERAGR